MKYSEIFQNPQARFVLVGMGIYEFEPFSATQARVRRIRGDFPETTLAGLSRPGELRDISPNAQIEMVAAA